MSHQRFGSGRADFFFGVAVFFQGGPHDEAVCMGDETLDRFRGDSASHENRDGPRRGLDDGLQIFEIRGLACARTKALMAHLQSAPLSCPPRHEIQTHACRHMAQNEQVRHGQGRIQNRELTRINANWSQLRGSEAVDLRQEHEFALIRVNSR